MAPRSSRALLSIAVAFAAPVLASSALASSALARSASAASAAARPTAFTVYAGPNLAQPPAGLNKQADALAFFPHVTTVHAGDTVTWRFRGFHTVTFPDGKKPYPFVGPGTGLQPATNDAAGNPFWWSGKAPVLAVSPLAIAPQGGPAISSTSDLRSSGLARVLAAPANAEPKPYSLRFTAPGTYRYQCAVHPGMRGIVRVLRPRASVPSPAAQKAAGAAELQRTIADAKSLDASKPPSSLHVLVGVGRNATGAEIAAFYPSSLDVKVGDTVTFQSGDQTDLHTVTFGPDALRAEIEKTFLAPQGQNVVVNPLGAYGSEPAGAALAYDGANHGNGYLNTGLVEPLGAPPAAGPQSFQITFTKPGTYRYECTIHQNMDGTIVVH